MATAMKNSIQPHLDNLEEMADTIREEFCNLKGDWKNYIPDVGLKDEFLELREGLCYRMCAMPVRY